MSRRALDKNCPNKLFYVQNQCISVVLAVCIVFGGFGGRGEMRIIALTYSP